MNMQQFIPRNPDGTRKTNVQLCREIAQLAKAHNAARQPGDYRVPDRVIAFCDQVNNHPELDDRQLNDLLARGLINDIK